MSKALVRSRTVDPAHADRDRSATHPESGTVRVRAPRDVAGEQPDAPQESAAGPPPAAPVVQRKQEIVAAGVLFLSLLGVLSIVTAVFARTIFP